MTRTFAPEPVTEWEDIQALAASGLGALAASCFLLLDVADVAAARAWLAATRPTSVADINAARADGRIVSTALQLALSAPGLAALGLAPAVIDQFGPEFRQGLASDDSRSRRLGDIGANDPANWDWGRGADVPHLLVMLYATPDALDGYVDAVLAAIGRAQPVLNCFVTVDEDGARRGLGFALAHHDCVRFHRSVLRLRRGQNPIGVFLHHPLRHHLAQQRAYRLGVEPFLAQDVQRFGTRQSACVTDQVEGNA